MSTPNTIDKLKEIIADQTGAEIHSITDTETMKEIGLDSLDIYDIVLAIEEDFDIDIEGDRFEKITDSTTLTELAAIVDELATPQIADAEPSAPVTLAGPTEEKEIKFPERTRRYEDSAPPADIDIEAAGRNVMVGFRVVSKEWDQVRHIFAEVMGKNPALLKMALKEGHGIEIGPEDNPRLYFVVDQDQKDAMSKLGVHSPTWLQLLGTTRVVALTEEKAIERFTALMENE